MAGLRSQERVISIHPDHFMCFTSGLAAGTGSLLKLISGALAGRNGLLKSLVPLRGSSWLLPPSEHMLNRAIEQALLVSLTLLGQMKDVANGNKTPRTDEGKSRGSFTGGVWKKDEPKTRNLENIPSLRTCFVSMCSVVEKKTFTVYNLERGLCFLIYFLEATSVQ